MARRVRDCGQSQLPNGRHFLAVWICRKITLHASQLRIRNSALNNRIHRAGLLAKATVNAFGHIYIITGGAAAAVIARLGVNGDGLRRANRFAKLTGNTAFFPIRIAAQSMFTAEPWAQGSFFMRVVQSRLGRKKYFIPNLNAAQKSCSKKYLTRRV